MTGDTLCFWVKSKIASFSGVFSNVTYTNITAILLMSKVTVKPYDIDEGVEHTQKKMTHHNYRVGPSDFSQA